VNTDPEDVFQKAIRTYAEYLTDLESNDVRLLKRQLKELERMRSDLERDLDEERTNEEAMLE